MGTSPAMIDNAEDRKKFSAMCDRNGIDQPELLESQINNIPGVLENGLFVNLTDEVLVGKVENDVVGVESLNKI